MEIPYFFGKIKTIKDQLPTSCSEKISYYIFHFNFLTFIFGGLRKYNNLCKQKTNFDLSSGPWLICIPKKRIDFNGKIRIQNPESCILHILNGKEKGAPLKRNMNIDDE